ncbi:MAG: hypothetical protein IIA50_04400, partial [Bacteroidetes bacterium]|nr:hypothetical protein [Bacteroidota bacterium]
MNSRSHPSYHLAQLGALLTKPGFELDRKLVVVPAAQTGSEILVSLTVHGYAWVNVTASTLLRFAREVVEEARPDTPYRYVSPAGAALTIDRFLTESKSKDADVLRRSARSMARTIRDLRLAGVSLRSFDRVVVSRFGRLVSITYRSYLEWLESESLLDDASVLDAATGLFSGAGVLRPPAILAVLDEVTLPDQALRFVESMVKRTGEVWRIGWDATNGQPPVLTAASRLAHWAIPAIESSSEVTDVPGEDGIGISTNREIGILVGTGAENEVRAVFRSVVENEMSLDSVEIAYAANDPYLKIIRSLSSRYDLPVTLAAGVPALDTATGQAIRTFLNWIREGLPGAGLVGMLRGGLVRLSVVDSNGSRDLSELTADVLSGVRTGKGKDGYDAALTILHRESVAGAKRAAGTFASDEAVARVQELEDVAEALAPLLELADLPPKLSVSRLVECLRRFILDFAPVNHPPEKNLLSGGGQVSVDPLHDLEQVARQELITRFSQLAEQIGDVVPLVSLIRHAQDLIAIAFVQARAAMPGFMHAVPLSSAGFTGRPNLYVVGLDEQTTGRTVSEDPLLPDEDREELARAGAGRLPISRHLTGRDSWFLTRAISRANGRISLLYSNYSVADDRELYPSSALHRIMSVRNEKIDSLPVHGYDYGGNEYLPLDETDVFLASRSDPRALSVCL